MSDRVPTFRFGDRVRVMQTRTAEEMGLANRFGTVAATPKTPANDVSVTLDDVGHGETHAWFRASSLMKAAE